MTTVRDQLDVIEFAVVMAQEFPEAGGLCPRLAELCRLARRYQRYQERACNRELSPAEQKAETRIGIKIGEIAREIDPRIVVWLGGDPRGCAVKLKLPSGRTNDFGGEGICLPC